MRRTVKRWVWMLVVCAWAGQGLGCATTSAREEQRLNARKAVSHLEIGGDHLANGRSALALREFLAAETLDPENAQVQNALGEAYWARGKRDEAEVHLQRALDLFPAYHDARMNLSALLLKQQRYEEVVAACDILIDDPTFASPWRALTNRGSALYKLGRHEEARESLALAREYRLEYWPATLALAVVEAETGRRLEAIRLYREIIAQGLPAPVESEVNYRLAEVYVALGKRREAMGHLTTSVARAPGSPWARKSQEYLKLLN